MKLYKVKEAAVLLGMSPDSVANLCRSGRLRAIRPGPRSSSGRGHWLIADDDIRSFVAREAEAVAPDVVTATKLSRARARLRVKDWN